MTSTDISVQVILEANRRSVEILPRLLAEMSVRHVMHEANKLSASCIKYCVCDYCLSLNAYVVSKIKEERRLINDSYSRRSIYRHPLRSHFVKSSKHRSNMRLIQEEVCNNL